MWTFSPDSPPPNPGARAVSTHVSAKEGECQIAPHPLVSDPQPRTVFLNLELNPLPSLLLPPTLTLFFLKER